MSNVEQNENNENSINSSTGEKLPQPHKSFIILLVVFLFKLIYALVMSILEILMFIIKWVFYWLFGQVVIAGVIIFIGLIVMAFVKLFG